MSSDHHHAVKNIKIAFFLNFAFTLLEIGGGLWTNSVAILADALHDLGDSVALGLSWYLAKVSQKKPDDQFSYGYQRFSLLGALISSLILLVGSIGILFEAIPRILSPETPHLGGMIVLAMLGVVVNGIAVLRLQSGKTHNEQVVKLHLLEDVLGWIAVLVVSVVMLFVDLPVLDPVLSVIITCYILWGVVRNSHETIKVFLQAIPSNIDTQQLETLLTAELPIRSIHDWHLWTMDGEYHVLSFHIVIADHLSSKEIILLKKRVREILKQRHIWHSTIEIEYENEFCELGNG